MAYHLKTPVIFFPLPFFHLREEKASQKKEQKAAKEKKEKEEKLEETEKAKKQEREEQLTFRVTIF